MRFSVRQILASTAGAVIAALIASIFGVKGTVIGVAIGSAAATIGTAFVSQSIERGHEAVKQVVRAPDASPLLRRLGSTAVIGGKASDSDVSSAPTEAVESAHDPTLGTASTTAPVEETRRLEVSTTAGTPATQGLRSSTTPAPPSARGRPGTSANGPSRFTWRVIAGTAVVVFVIALLFITAVELIAGKPLAAIFGGGDSGTSFGNVVSPSPPATSTTTTSTVPATSTTSTTSGSSTSTTTSTTAPTATSTTTVPPSRGTTTTTTGVGSTASTTTTSVATSP